MHMAETSQASPSLRLLASAMRRIPREVRKTWWWWERLYQKIDGGGFNDAPEVDSKWPGGLQAPISTRPFGAKVRLNLQLWPERRTYFSGSYYQEELERLYPQLLRPGDQYLDIGANIGMTALMASAIIGERGRGFAFEPNPEMFERLKNNFELNRVSNLELVPFALAETESEATLYLPAAGNTGVGSLALAPEEAGRRFQVRVVTGQPYLDQLDSTKTTFLKIDVEGYEVHVLKGVRDALDWPEIAVLAEVSAEMLARAGDTIEDMERLLGDHGLRPYRMTFKRERFGRRLNIEGPLGLADAVDANWCDVLFLKPESKFRRERVASVH